MKHTDLITELKNRESKPLFQTKLYGKTYKVNDYFIVIDNGEYFFPRYDVAVYKKIGDGQRAGWRYSS